MAEFAVATAPASIGNVGVGFDILGQAFDAARDEVTAVREPRKGVRLGDVSGLTTSLPASPRENSALAAALAVIEAAEADFGVRLSIVKGIPLSGGMGGSAASAVAGAAAANALLPVPFDHDALLPFALQGERVSSDPPPWDNVVASLYGGLVMVASESCSLVRRLPVPQGLVSILVHPAVRIETRTARRLLRDQVPMALAVEHSRRLAAFVTGCATDDRDLLRAGLEDLLVEPQRETLLPSLPRVKKAALEAGAIGCSFSGAGPAVFAWAPDEAGDAVEAAMKAAFADCEIDATAYRAPIDSPGVRIEQMFERALVGAA